MKVAVFGSGRAGRGPGSVPLVPLWAPGPAHLAPLTGRPSRRRPTAPVACHRNRSFHNLMCALRDRRRCCAEGHPVGAAGRLWVPVAGCWLYGCAGLNWGDCRAAGGDHGSVGPAVRAEKGGAALLELSVRELKGRTF